jgi:hypothetical protein
MAAVRPSWRFFRCNPRSLSLGSPTPSRRGVFSVPDADANANANANADADADANADARSRVVCARFR